MTVITKELYDWSVCRREAWEPNNVKNCYDCVITGDDVSTIPTTTISTTTPTITSPPPGSNLALGEFPYLFISLL